MTRKKGLGYWGKPCSVCGGALASFNTSWPPLCSEHWNAFMDTLRPQEPALGAWSGENIAASRWLGECDEQPEGVAV